MTQLADNHLSTLKTMLRDEEALKLKPYRCTSGKLTIGIGRNLDDRGITEPEAYYLLENDIKYHTEELTKRLPFFNNLDPMRQIVLIDMAFNLGINNLLKFKKTLSYIEKGDYVAASREMLNSKWSEQVGRRADRLSCMMKTGQYQKLW